MWVKTRDNSIAKCFKTFDETLSGPAPFDGFKLMKCRRTSLSDTTMPKQDAKTLENIKVKVVGNNASGTVYEIE